MGKFTFRKKESEEVYVAYTEERKKRGENACPLCAESSLVEFELWRIINNNFPYDRIATTHHMIIPKRHVDEFGLTEQERTELLALKYDYIDKNYNFILEPVLKGKTLPSHFHPHLIVGKPEEE